MVEPALAAPRARVRAGRLLIAVVSLICVGVWAWAAHALWHSTVPSVKLPHVDPHSYFSARYLARSASYERFLDIDVLLGDAVLVVVLALYARRGHRLMRESAAGPIGTGMLLGMLGFAVLWLAELPFDIASVWWQRRHGVSHQGYVNAILEGFFGLGGRFLFVCFALLLAMGLARFMGHRWWLAAGPLFTGVALLFSFLSVYLIPNTGALRDPTTAAEIRRLARAEGIPGTKAEVQEVHRFTTAPNAESVGFGSTRRVILWDTLLDGRFSRREVAVVSAHELGHLAHHHPLKRVGWLALFLIPAAALIALLTRGRGGLARPEAVPVALFVFVMLQLLTLPLWNIVSRHDEAEADWSALQATRDPTAASALFRGLATTSLANPNPPTWSYVLNGDHPTIVQRLAMVETWQRQAGR